MSDISYILVFRFLALISSFFMAYTLLINTTDNWSTLVFISGAVCLVSTITASILENTYDK